MSRTGAAGGRLGGLLRQQQQRHSGQKHEVVTVIPHKREVASREVAAAAQAAVQAASSGSDGRLDALVAAARLAAAVEAVHGSQLPDERVERGPRSAEVTVRRRGKYHDYFWNDVVELGSRIEAGDVKLAHLDQKNADGTPKLKVPKSTMQRWRTDDKVVRQRQGLQGIAGVPHWRAELEVRRRQALPKIGGALGGGSLLGDGMEKVLIATLHAEGEKRTPLTPKETEQLCRLAMRRGLTNQRTGQPHDATTNCTTMAAKVMKRAREHGVIVTSADHIAALAAAAEEEEQVEARKKLRAEDFVKRWKPIAKEAEAKIRDGMDPNSLSVKHLAVAAVSRTGHRPKSKNNKDGAMADEVRGLLTNNPQSIFVFTPPAPTAAGDDEVHHAGHSGSLTPPPLPPTEDMEVEEDEEER